MPDGKLDKSGLKKIEKNALTIKRSPVKTGGLFLVYTVTGTALGTCLLSLLTHQSLIAFITVQSNCGMVAMFLFFCLVGSFVYPSRQNLPAQYAKNQPNFSLRIPMLVVIMPLFMVICHYASIDRVSRIPRPTKEVAKSAQEYEVAMKDWHVKRDKEKSHAQTILYSAVALLLVYGGVEALIKRKRESNL